MISNTLEALDPGGQDAPHDILDHFLSSTVGHVRSPFMICIHTIFFNDNL